MEANKKSNSTADRELFVSRLLNAPRELVWEVWTNPEHIANWWGPEAFSNTINTMDLKPGGEWNLVMHGPDGTDYKNKSIFREVIEQERIVYEHMSAPKFLATITFTEKGKQTLLEWHMLFETVEQFAQVVKTFKADEGLKQNVEKLDKFLDKFYQAKQAV
ncbi:SRPBCC family protein [soil metagenome]